MGCSENADEWRGVFKTRSASEILTNETSHIITAETARPTQRLPSSLQTTAGSQHKQQQIRRVERGSRQDSPYFRGFQTTKPFRLRSAGSFLAQGEGEFWSWWCSGGKRNEEARRPIESCRASEWWFVQEQKLGGIMIGYGRLACGLFRWEFIKDERSVVVEVERLGKRSCTGRQSIYKFCPLPVLV